jgi:hypothetical protein
MFEQKPGQRHVVRLGGAGERPQMAGVLVIGARRIEALRLTSVGHIAKHRRDEH